MLKQIMIQTNIWEAFREIWFEFDVRIELYRLLSDKDELRAILAFWDI
jgi:hypothetical protein